VNSLNKITFFMWSLHCC